MYHPGRSILRLVLDWKLLPCKWVRPSHAFIRSSRLDLKVEVRPRKLPVTNLWAPRAWTSLSLVSVGNIAISVDALLIRRLDWSSELSFCLNRRSKPFSTGESIVMRQLLCFHIWKGIVFDDPNPEKARRVTVQIKISSTMAFKTYNRDLLIRWDVYFLDRL